MPPMREDMIGGVIDHIVLGRFLRGQPLFYSIANRSIRSELQAGRYLKKNDRLEHASSASLCESELRAYPRAGLLEDRVITIMGPSKTESLSGYPLGIAFGAPAVIERMEKLQAIVSLRAAGDNQAVLRTWFREPKGWLEERICLTSSHPRRPSRCLSRCRHAYARAAGGQLSVSDVVSARGRTPGLRAVVAPSGRRYRDAWNGVWSLSEQHKAEFLSRSYGGGGRRATHRRDGASVSEVRAPALRQWYHRHNRRTPPRLYGAETCIRLRAWNMKAGYL